MSLVTGAYLKEVVSFYEKWSLAVRLISNFCVSSRLENFIHIAITSPVCLKRSEI